MPRAQVLQLPGSNGRGAPEGLALGEIYSDFCQGSNGTDEIVVLVGVLC